MDRFYLKKLPLTMLCSLTVVRYPKWLGWAGFLSMAIFRIPLWLAKQKQFYKLMGCGKNGTFDIVPDFRQWALLEYPVNDSKQAIENTDTPIFIQRWWHFFGCEVWRIVLEPIEGHGTWDGKMVFGDLPKSTTYNGIIGVLTRATIRTSKLVDFWKNVAGVARKMDGAPGFITSLGIGEIPWIKQATFSIWLSKEHMKQFAYQMPEHAEVIKKTRKEDWYSEDMFVRFKIISTRGKIKGSDPLAGKL